jgi:choline-sulfatase
LSQQTSKPNLIFILSDQHSGDWMNCAGSRIVQTPNLDALAEGGVRFTQAYCNAPLCVPSRMSMLTGLHPHHTGVHGNDDYLASDIPTFAHALSMGGYETVLCGRMHFNGIDQRHGFGQRLVGDITSPYLGGPNTRYGALQGTAGQGMRSIEAAGTGGSPVQDFDEAVTRGFEQFVSEVAASGAANVATANDNGNASANQSGIAQAKPLFVTVGLYGPHHPYVAPPELYDQALAAMEQHDAPIPKDELRHPWLEQWFRKLKADNITPEQLRTARAAYAGLVSKLDQLVGRIVKAAAQLPGDTWIVYASDHGEMAGDRGMFWKRSLFEGATHIPLIWYPLRESGDRRLKRGATVDAPVSLVDLAPTFSAVTGSPALPQQDGNDLSPLLFASDPAAAAAPGAIDWQQRAVFTELVGRQDSAIRAVRRGDYKLVYYHGFDPLQLFNIANDPHEKHDLAGDPTYRQVIEELKQLLFNGWNPKALLDETQAHSANHHFLAQWGKEVGMGPLDLWNQPAN